MNKAKIAVGYFTRQSNLHLHLLLQFSRSCGFAKTTRSLSVPVPFYQFLISAPFCPNHPFGPPLRPPKVKPWQKEHHHLALLVLTDSVSGSPPGHLSHHGHTTFCWRPRRAARLASRSIPKGLRWPRGIMGTSLQNTHQIAHSLQNFTPQLPHTSAKRFDA